MLRYVLKVINHSLQLLYVNESRQCSVLDISLNIGKRCFKSVLTMTKVFNKLYFVFHCMILTGECINVFLTSEIITHLYAEHRWYCTFYSINYYSIILSYFSESVINRNRLQLG